MLVLRGKIPVSIHPFFWIFAAIIGWINSEQIIGMFVWVGIIVVSVLFHEFGHALTAVMFKQKASIQLIPLGGVTTFDGPKLKFWQQFLITLNGPVFGFLLFVLATLILQSHWIENLFWLKVIKMTQIANLFWTIINLLPVLPLDGGQLLRIVLEANFGIKGYKAALLIGAALSGLIALYFFVIQAFLIGAFFFLFAFQSFDSWRKSRYATRDDREDENRKMMILAETALNQGNREEAKRLLEEVRSKTGTGVLGVASSQYLAFIAAKEGRRQDAYDLLLPIKEHLEETALCLLHSLAAERKNYSLVAELSTECYQVSPSQEMALRNARAFASLNEAKVAGGWIQTAWQDGEIDLNHLLNEEEFQKVKENPEFKVFTDPLKEEPT